MIINFKKIFSVSTTAGILGLAACSSAPQRPAPRPAPEAGQAAPQSEQALGEVRSQAGQTDYQTKRVVVQTEKERIPTVTQTKTGADINRMTASDFVALGLPQNQADDIIQQRELHGAFKSVSDLGNLPNIDPTWFDQNKDRLAVQKTG